MEYFNAQQLKDSWGKKPCNHPGFEKVFYSGAFLITYACIQCGAEFTISEKMEIDTSRGIKKCRITHTKSTKTIN